MFTDTQKRFKIDRFCQVQHLSLASVEPMSIWVDPQINNRGFIYHGFFYNQEQRRWRVELSALGCSNFIYQDFLDFEAKIKTGTLTPQKNDNSRSNRRC